MQDNYRKLKKILREMFQMDQADLDFGIYRIMNQKRDEITHFLDNDLLPQVKAAFEQYRPADKKVIEAELQKAIHGAEVLGVDPNSVPKVKEIREQLETERLALLRVELCAGDVPISNHRRHRSAVSSFRHHHAPGACR